MRSRLNQVSDWEQLADPCRYSVHELAQSCGVTVRQLERFFVRTKGLSPHQWLSELRQRRALELIQKGHLVKQVAVELGYRQTSHFSRAFRRFHAAAPTQILLQSC